MTHAADDSLLILIVVGAVRTSLDMLRWRQMVVARLADDGIGRVEERACWARHFHAAQDFSAARVGDHRSAALVGRRLRRTISDDREKASSPMCDDSHSQHPSQIFRHQGH